MYFHSLFSPERERPPHPKEAEESSTTRRGEGENAPLPTLGGVAFFSIFFGWFCLSPIAAIPSFLWWCCFSPWVVLGGASRYPFVELKRDDDDILFPPPHSMKVVRSSPPSSSLSGGSPPLPSPSVVVCPHSPLAVVPTPQPPVGRSPLPSLRRGFRHLFRPRSGVDPSSFGGPHFWRSPRPAFGWGVGSGVGLGVGWLGGVSGWVLGGWTVGC